MLIIETPTFTRLIVSLIDDEEYSKLQDELVKRPDAGDLIKDGGGIRKLRWKRAGTGKSGGIRVILKTAVDHAEARSARRKSRRYTQSGHHPLGNRPSSATC